VFKDHEKGAEQARSVFLWDWLVARWDGLYLLIVRGQGEFGEILFFLYDKDLSRARGDCLPHLLQEIQGRTFLENLHDAIAFALAKHLASGQDAGPTGNTSIGQGGDFH
jgi:hypothetical protein